jgi:hypothetical protein
MIGLIGPKDEGSAEQWLELFLELVWFLLDVVFEVAF